MAQSEHGKNAKCIFMANELNGCTVCSPGRKDAAAVE